MARWLTYPVLFRSLEALPPGWLDGEPMPLGDGSGGRPPSREQSQAAMSGGSQREGSEPDGAG